MLDIGGLVAARRRHPYANTRLWRQLNALLTGIFDNVDLLIFFAGAPFIHSRVDNARGLRALDLFRRVVRRHMADLAVHDKSAFSDNFGKTLSAFASIRALKKLHPLAEDMYGLRYLDFLYLQILACRRELSGERLIVEVTWNEPGLFEDVCRLPNSCIILILHSRFPHGTRALSYSRKRLAVVGAYPDRILQFYKENKINNPEDIEIIPVNRETLLTLTKVAQKNKAIICSPDLVNPKTGRLDLLSIGMFQLAKYANVPLYFFDFCIDDNCLLRGFIKGPVDCAAGPVKAAEEFVSFCQSISGRTLTIIESKYN